MDTEMTLRAVSNGEGRGRDRANDAIRRSGACVLRGVAAPARHERDACLPTGRRSALPQPARAKPGRCGCAHVGNRSLLRFTGTKEIP
ncbi:hypothetical protein FHW13_002431 [Dokdonella fugitiva]|nr:hypothetical protein [Dokdonella fugitiva]